MKQIPYQSPNRIDPEWPIPGMTVLELTHQLEDGAIGVRYEYCLSPVVATLRYQSRVHLTHSWEMRVLRGIPYSLLAVLLGLWGLPWGPVLTLRACWVNLCGGVDVTNTIEDWLDQQSPTGCVE